MHFGNTSYASCLRHSVFMGHNLLRGSTLKERIMTRRGIGRLTVFSGMMQGKINGFKLDFKDTAKNIFIGENGNRHNGEFGAYREKSARAFLRSFIPSRLAISDGFVVNRLGEVTTQADVIIYDAQRSPMIETTNHQKFFPIEAVCAIGEIKSSLTRSRLKQALQKLAVQKSFKSTHVHSNGKRASFRPIEREHLITFLICEKIVNSTPQDINIAIMEAYRDARRPIELWDRHNLILSLDGGLGLYANPDLGRDKSGEQCSAFAYPENLQARRFLWAQANVANENDHIAQFCSLLFRLTRDAVTKDVQIHDYTGQPCLQYTEGHQLVSSSITNAPLLLQPSGYYYPA